MINSAQRIGLSACGAVGVEQEIVKIPKNEAGVTLGRSYPVAAGSIETEQNLTIHQQCEEFDPRKAVLPPEFFELLRRGQHNKGGSDLRITNSEQRTGA